jgi:hypothetical protein
VHGVPIAPHGVVLGTLDHATLRRGPTAGRDELELLYANVEQALKARPLSVDASKDVSTAEAAALLLKPLFGVTSVGVTARHATHPPPGMCAARTSGSSRRSRRGSSRTSSRGWTRTAPARSRPASSLRLQRSRAPLPLPFGPIQGLVRPNRELARDFPVGL